jgi:hypothetical protein
MCTFELTANRVNGRASTATGDFAYASIQTNEAFITVRQDVKPFLTHRPVVRQYYPCAFGDARPTLRPRRKPIP